MVSNNLKLGVGLSVVLVALFTGAVVKYSMRRDPLTVEHSAEWSDRKAQEVTGGEDLLGADNDLLTTLGGDYDGAVTQSTEKLDNRRERVTTTFAETAAVVKTTAAEKVTTAEGEVGDPFAETTTTKAAAVETEEGKVGKALDKAAAAHDAALDKLNKANDALTAAQTNVDTYQTKLDEAKVKLDEAQAKFDESQAENYNRGLYGFYEYIGSQEGMDAFNSSEYSGVVESGNRYDAASIERVKNALTLIKNANKLRVEEGKPEFKISHKLMALAVLNNDMASVNGESSNNTEFDEDLAYGFEDPLDAWYYDEREYNGANYQSLMNENYVAAGAAYSVLDGRVHNILMASDDQDHGVLMTVAEFEKDFNPYYEVTIKGRDASREQSSYDNISQKLEDAKQKVADKEEAVRTASEKYEAAKKTYEEKLAAYQALQ